MTQLQLAKELNLSRSTIQYYINRGMPKALTEAREWLDDYRAKPRSDGEAIAIPSLPVSGDQFEDRLARLRSSERSIASEIQGANQLQMDLVSELVGSDGAEKAKVEKRLAAVGHRLIALRKQHMGITKILCDLELKKQSLAKDLIDIGTVHDVMVRLNMRFAQYVRHLCDCDYPSETDRQIMECYRTLTNVIAAELNKMVKDLIFELRNPVKENVYDTSRKNS
jgi:hypothetical protein